ncbi:hypothetical protein CBR69_22120 [Bordetella hinzii]|nr:hypothetical protein CBR69_22120 [Bordetella hinzii]
MIAIALVPVLTTACSLFKPDQPDSGRYSISKDIFHNSKKNDLPLADAFQDFGNALEHCHKILNFYENRATHSRTAKLALGITGAIAGSVLGPVAIAAGWGSAWGAMFSGIAGTSSAALTGIDQVGLGSDQYLMYRAEVQKTVVNAFAVIGNPPTKESVMLATAMLLMCTAAPTPNQPSTVQAPPVLQAKPPAEASKIDSAEKK